VPLSLKGSISPSSIHMRSWDALDPFSFKPAGSGNRRLPGQRQGRPSCRCKIRVWMRYGRNSDPNDPLIVLAEQRETCSTKHALLRRLAIEQGLDLALVLGIYEMMESNTPGVGPVLRRYGLGSVLEAHCYLRTGRRRIDATKASSGQWGGEPLRFLHEEEIDPSQMTGYKTSVHKKFLKRWMTDKGGLRGLSLDEVWAIREECIASLAESPPGAIECLGHYGATERCYRRLAPTLSTRSTNCRTRSPVVKTRGYGPISAPKRRRARHVG
jgi:hypothetical protein